MSQLRDAAIRLMAERGLERRDEPFTLASGHVSHDYIDAKYAVDSGERLTLVSRAVVELVAGEGHEFSAVGGLTMGADALAHGISMVSGCRWFSVRKQQKQRGRDQWVEGTRLSEDDRVLLVDDIVTMGGSIRTAYERLTATGAGVVCATTMVDRGETGRRIFAELGVAYHPLMTYRDLGIEPVGPSSLASTPGS